MRTYTICILLLLLTLSSCKNKEAGKNSEATAERNAEIEYTCSMHPQIKEKKPGNCPICGMTLVTRTLQHSADSSLTATTFLDPVDGYLLTGLPLVTLTDKNVKQQIELIGTIEYDSRAMGAIAAQADGRIVKTYVHYRYQEVDAGQKLLDLYSPALVTEQQNYLFLLANDAENTSLVSAAREKLILMGISEQQVKTIERTHKPLLTISIYSKFSGHIHEPGMDDRQSETPTGEMESGRTANTDLLLREGAYVQKGQTLFTVMSHHQVWAALQVAADHISSVKKGMQVTLLPESDSAQTINGQIDFLEPVLRAGTRTATARVSFHNAMKIPAGTNVKAVIQVPSQLIHVLPRSAVISLGVDQIIFRKEGKGFRAHKILTGLIDGNDIQILTGINDQDSVVADAQYLTDRESFIKTNSK